MKIGLPVLSTVAFLVLSLASGFGQAAANTRVSGSVRDAAGKSITHAYVEAIPVITNGSGGTVGSSSNPWVAADSSGIFTLTLRPGRYRIRAKDEVDGYPDPSFWVNLDSKARFPEITVVDRDGEARNIEVVLGAQGAILGGEVRDAQTHTSLAGAKIRIQDARNSAAYVEVFTNSNGHFQYTIPSKPLLISVTAPTYKVTDLDGGAEVTVSPGGHREFQLDLEHK